MQILICEALALSLFSFSLCFLTHECTKTWINNWFVREAKAVYRTNCDLWELSNDARADRSEQVSKKTPALDEERR